jgi:glucose-6-phosphate isomerase
MGQWMQEGVRSVFETFLVLAETSQYRDGPEIRRRQRRAQLPGRKELSRRSTGAPIRARSWRIVDGGVPAMTLLVENRSEETLGQLFYFFEKAIALSGYLLRVNPFDQPGVEAYKKNMFALLGKKGYEKQRETLANRIKGIIGT